jgi:hypothetical protein
LNVIPKKIETVELSDIEALVENSVPESRTLDYKEVLPDGTDDSKRSSRYESRPTLEGSRK